MKILNTPRRSGKTTKMIAWLREDPRRLLVTFSHREVERLVILYPDLVNRIVEWKAYVDRRSYAYPMHPKQIAIDNADIILQMVCRDGIDIITLTGEELV